MSSVIRGQERTVSITRIAGKHGLDRDFAGRVSVQELIDTFDDPASGVFLMQPRAQRWIVRLHLGLRSVLAQVPHPESYTLPTREFEECLQRYDHQLHDRTNWALIDRTHVDLLTIPPRRLRKRYNLSYFALRLWSARFGGAVYVQCQLRREAEQLNELLLRRCIQLIGPVRFEEIRDVLVDEQLLREAHDDMEVLFEFAAYYLQLKLFSPLELFLFFPSLRGCEALVDDLLELIGVDAERALHESRLPRTPEVSELMEGAKWGLRQEKQQEDTRFQPAHKAQLVLADPLLTEAARHALHDEQQAISSVIEAVVERMIQPGGILGKSDFVEVRNLAVKLGHDLELNLLLKIDLVLQEQFPNQYVGSTRWQRLQLGLRSSRAIAADSKSTDRRAITSRTLTRFLAIMDQQEAPQMRWRRWTIYLLAGWIVEWIGRRLELWSPIALRLADRFRLLHFQHFYESARSYQQQANLAHAMIQLRRARGVLASVCDRLPLPEADQAAEKLAQSYQALVGPFCDNLAGNFDLSGPQREELERLIEYLVHQVSFHDHGVASQLLLELERSHVRSLRKVQGFDPRGWIGSLGREPLVIDLPQLEKIRRLQHLRKARFKATQLPLPPGVLEAYTAVIERACHNAGVELHRAIDPLIAGAFEEIQFLPQTPHERIAYLKIREELARYIVEHGFSHYSTLRDVLSHNQLKLPDWSIWSLISGDPLVQLDRAFARRLPGIHHRGEVYLKLFQLPTVLGFGTAPGRILVRALLLPFAAAATLLVLVKISAGHFISLPGLRDPRLLALLGFSLGLLIHLPPLRSALRLICWHPLRLLYRLLSKAMIALPRIVKGVLVYPMIGTAISLPLLFLTRPQLFDQTQLIANGPRQLSATTLVTCACYLFWLLLANTRVGVFVGGVISDICSTLIQAVGKGLLMRLYYLILGLSQAAIRQLEWIDYRVSAALRLIGGERRSSLALKALAGLAWFPFYYVTRFYVLLFLEPQINPLKFPAVSVSYKILVPYYLEVQTAAISFCGLLLPGKLAAAVGGTLTFFSTGIFGFLFWELKENWKLYRSNASREVHPLAVGSHGETIATYLRPGFHSGTIPRLFRQRRQALAQGTESLRAARALRQFASDRDHIISDLTHFLDCDLVLPLRQHELFRECVQVQTGQVEITANSISFSLGLTFERFAPLELHLLMEENHGVLIAGLQIVSGAIGALTQAQQATLAYHLGLFYKLSAVDLVREEIERHLTLAYPNHSLTDRRASNQVLYDVQGNRLRLSFIERTDTRSLGERMITALWPRPTQRMITLKDQDRFGTRRLYWEDFNCVHRPGGHQLGDGYLHLLKASH